MIRSIRNVRAEVNVPMSKKIEMIVKPSSEEPLRILENNRHYVERFCNTSQLTMSLDAAAPEKAMSAIVTGAEMFLPLAGLIDIDQEIARLEKELKTLNAEVERVEKKLANPGFVAKAPAAVIEEEKAKMNDYADKREKVIARIAELKG